MPTADRLRNQRIDQENRERRKEFLCERLAELSDQVTQMGDYVDGLTPVQEAGLLLQLGQTFAGLTAMLATLRIMQEPKEETSSQPESASIVG